MKASIVALVTLFALPNARAENKATAEWIPESTAVAAGKEFRTVINLKIDEDWHTYWENPGEGGLPISVDAELPEGWTLGKIQFPTPIAFMTGSLHGFGYQNEVLFPLTITPPVASEATKLPEGIVAKISWLSCNDGSCVPGEAELSLGEAQPDLVEESYAALPIRVPGASLNIDAKAKILKLRLTLPSSWNVDISNFKVFPVTRNIVDPSADFRFKRDNGGWTAEVPKSEYLDESPKSLTILIVGSKGRAWEVSTAPAALSPDL